MHERAPAPASDGRIEIKLVSSHRVRISGRYEPEALARLIEELS